jgi:hypothetical protein
MGVPAYSEKVKLMEEKRANSDIRNRGGECCFLQLEQCQRRRAGLCEATYSPRLGVTSSTRLQTDRPRSLESVWEQVMVMPVT